MTTENINASGAPVQPFGKPSAIVFAQHACLEHVPLRRIKQVATRHKTTCSTLKQPIGVLNAQYGAPKQSPEFFSRTLSSIDVGARLEGDLLHSAHGKHHYMGYGPNIARQCLTHCFSLGKQPFKVLRALSSGELVGGSPKYELGLTDPVEDFSEAHHLHFAPSSLPIKVSADQHCGCCHHCQNTCCKSCVEPTQHREIGPRSDRAIQPVLLPFGADAPLNNKGHEPQQGSPARDSNRNPYPVSHEPPRFCVTEANRCESVKKYVLWAIGTWSKQ